jgi:hypothetical protein
MKNLVVLFSILGGLLVSLNGVALSASSVVVVVAEEQGAGVLQVAEVLAYKMKKFTDIPVIVGDGPTGAFDLAIHLRIEADPTAAPESYRVQTTTVKGAPAVVGVGVDLRGVLYAAGEIIRQCTFSADSLCVAECDVSSAPAYRYRGFSANQGGTMMKMTKARGWTREEYNEALMDYALAGANAFYAGRNGGAVYDFLKSMDLMTITDARPNEYRQEFPESWAAGGLESWEGDHWICPSLPECRKALMDTWKADFAQRADHDVFRMYAGDPGGCRDERCAPWGKTFIELCEEVGKLWLKDHPDSIVLVANQDLTNEGDRAIFRYMNEKPQPWLYGICYAPGSNALSEYFREELREDLFVYPGGGPMNRYLAEIHRQLPPEMRIVHFSDITHWISAQYKVNKPEPNLVKSFGRRTFHTRPEAFYRIFQAIMPFSEGDMIYSEGYHDEFHQYLWNRLLWNPNQPLETVMTEYCTLYFGEDAAPLMMAAMLQLEKTLELPLESNTGVDEFYALVKKAGWRIPANLMKNDHRWRLFMQKAALDKYVQLKLRTELDKERRIVLALQKSLESEALATGLDAALEVLDEATESPEMALLREEARMLGEQSEKLFAVRNVGFFKLDQSLRALPKMKEKIEEAQKESAISKKKQIMTDVMEMTTKKTKTGNIFW